MKEAFTKVASLYETVKKSVKEKWEAFNNNFEGTKTQISKEVSSAEKPEDLIALGIKLQEKGEALRLEKIAAEDSEKAEGVALAAKEDIEGQAYDEADAENKAFDENKAAEKAEAERLVAEKAEMEKAEAALKVAKEKAEHEEYVKNQEAEETAKLEEIRAKLSGGITESAPAENVEIAEVENSEEVQAETSEEKPTEASVMESQEKIQSPEEKRYDFFKGTLTFAEDGKMGSVFHMLRDNPIVMLEAYKKNPQNLHWVSKRLSKDPDFVRQMESLGAEVKDGELKSNMTAQRFEEVDSEAKPTREQFDKSKMEAVASNLARGSRSLEEMGVDKEFALAAIKDGLLKSVDYFSNGNTFDNLEQIERAVQAAGGNVQEMINDSDVRTQIVEQAIPRMCSRIAADKGSFEWMDRLLNNLSKTFNVTDAEWDKAKQSPWGGNSVRDYLNSQRRM